MFEPTTSESHESSRCNESPVGKGGGEEDESDKNWQNVHLSIEHHRLSKTYNDLLQQAFDGCSAALVQQHQLAVEAQNSAVESNDDDHARPPVDEISPSVDDSASQCQCSTPDTPVSDSPATMARSLAGRNPCRHPNARLLGEILSRTEKRDRSEPAEMHKRRRRSGCSNGAQVPRLDLSWLDEDDPEPAAGRFKRNDSRRWKHLTRESSIKKNHLKLYQIDSDPLVSSLDVVVERDDDKSHCSSPERLEKQENDGEEFSTAVMTTAKISEDFGTSLRIPFRQGRGAAIRLVTRNAQTVGMTKTSSKESRAFQEKNGDDGRVVAAGIHSNGNQNSRKKCPNKVVFRQIDKLCKTIEEEKYVESGANSDERGNSYAKLRREQELRWNTLDSCSKVSVGMNGEASIDTSQISFNVSQRGEPAATTNINNGERASEKFKIDASQLDVIETLTLMDRAGGDVEVVEKKLHREDGCVEKSTKKRCYCFFCGIHCGIWFC